MEKMVWSLSLFLILSSVWAAPVRQQGIVGFNDDKNADFTRFPDKKNVARRLAFPYANRALTLEFNAPVRPAKIVLHLCKLSLKSPEKESGAAGLKVFAGNDPGKLKLVADAKVVVESAVSNGQSGETVTVTGLPEARCFQLYAPRMKPDYVFGLADASKEIEVWADAPAVSGQGPSVIAYPELEKLDSSWKNAVLPLDGCGFVKLEKDEDAATIPYSGQGGNSRIAFPYKLRAIEFKLKNPMKVGKIILDLQKFQTEAPNFPTGLENATVYASNDGQEFRAVKPVVTTGYYRIGKEPYVRVTLAGKFVGRFFRIYAPQPDQSYVFGVSRLSNALNILPASAVMITEFTAPFSAGTPFPVTFMLKGISGTAGTVSVRRKDTDALLWRKKLSELPDGKSVSATIDPGTFAGTLNLKMVVEEKDSLYPQVREAHLRFNRDDVVLQPRNTDGWKKTTRKVGGTPVEFLTAEKSGAKLEFKVPANGNFAVYAIVRGCGRFKIEAPGLKGESGLQLWHPSDIDDALAGESFFGAAAMKAGDILSLEVAMPGAELGTLILSPIGDKQMSVYTAAPEIKPSAIIHADGYSDFFSGEITPEILRKRIDDYKTAGAFAYDWCVGTGAVNYPSRVATEFGQQKNVEFHRNGDRLAAERLQKLLRTGSDPIRILRDRSKEKELRFSVTQRACVHYSGVPSLNAQYFIDHPEFFMTDVNGKKHLKPSYAYPEVRKFYLDMICEIAAYKPDAIVIEFLRHPPFFMYDPPLVAEYTRRYGKCTPGDYLNENWQKMIGEIMTEHLKNVRQAIDDISPGTALEISFDNQDYRKQGIDLPAILKAGLVDMISPGIYSIGTSKVFPLSPFVAMIKESPRKVLLFPRVEGTIYGGDPTPKEEKGLEKIERRSLSVPMFKGIFLEFLAQGADGIRPFNTGGVALTYALSDRAALRRFAVFELPLLDIRSHVN